MEFYGDGHLKKECRAPSGFRENLEEVWVGFLSVVRDIWGAFVFREDSRTLSHIIFVSVRQSPSEFAGA